VNIRQNQSFNAVLEKALKTAGLPSNVSEVVGRSYRLGFKEETKIHILVGIIGAISLSDRDGLILYVSSPVLWDGELLHLVRFDESRIWQAVVRYRKDFYSGAASYSEIKYFEGELNLL
jgi:hypothetical protein